ncbi:putative signal transducing protein [Aliikangiella sp. IMCC44359]|uniref:putative signal transducing protein n=1 Tax=Aliikangiella sp. IMCC44359 TaxID=3459125 RepID=UPI00403AF379
MNKILSCENLLIINHYKNILEINDIPCFIKNELIQSAVGEVPAGIFWPELWVYDESNIQVATDLIKQICELKGLPDWFCPSCGEDNSGNFKICWQCNSSQS